MKLPEKNYPIIMVGPGTGVAAFRSFIQRLGNSDRTIVLIFGCRNKESDFYYQAEWKKYSNLKVIVAFSRD